MSFRDHKLIELSPPIKIHPQRLPPGWQCRGENWCISIKGRSQEAEENARPRFAQAGKMKTFFSGVVHDFV